MAVRSSASATVAVVFFLLEVALARTPSALYENEIAVRDSLPVSDVQSVLRLPSEIVKDESHSHPDPSLEGRVIPHPESVEPITATSVPLTVLRIHDLRPINRHFPLRSKFSFRHCRHRPHHHDHPSAKPMKKQAEISYGDDMIVSTGEEGKDLDPTRWVRLPYHHHYQRHHHDDDEDGFSKYVMKHGHRFGKEKLKKHLHRNDHQDTEEDETEEKRVKEERKKRENGKKDEGGFARRIRKFLDLF